MPLLRRTLPTHYTTLPRLAAALCLAALFGAPSSLLFADPPTEAAVKGMIAAGQFAEAIAGARERIAASPTDPDSHVLFANVLLGKARGAVPVLPDGSSSPISKVDAEAIVKELEEASRLAPQRKDIPLGIVDIWVAANRDDDMIRQIERCASSFPSDPGMMSGLLDYGAERQMRSDPLATRIYEAVYKGYPRQPDAILAWSSLILSQGDLERSIKVLETAEQAGVAGSDLLEALGDARSFQLDFQSALRYYARSASLDTTRVPVRLKWAAVLHLTDPRGARLLIEPLQTQGAGGKPEAMRVGKDGTIQPPSRIERVVNAMMRALTTPSFSAADAQLLASSFWQSGLSIEALAETELALTKDPLHVESLMLRAEIYTRAGLIKEALRTLDRAESALDTAQDRTFAFSRDEVVAARAASQARLGRSEEALATYKKTSDPSRYAYAMGVIAERLGRIDEARSLFEQVIASGRGPAEIGAAKSHLAQDVYRKKP